MSVHDHPYVVFLALLTYSSLGCDGLPGGRGVLPLDERVMGVPVLGGVSCVCAGNWGLTGGCWGWSY